MKRKIIIAIDSFKGCLTSTEAEAAVAEALHDALDDVETLCLPMSDGGEGMAETFTQALSGNLITTYVHDPMMRRISTVFGVTPDGTAIIEAAKACGLTLVKEEERNPMRATSYGVGELVAAAVKRGCRKFIVGLGGSGTSDAGIGMLKALTDILTKRGQTFDDALRGVLGECSFTLACDVSNPLLGPDGATAVFALQKGATPLMLPMLEQRAQRFARASAAHFGFDRSSLPGAGAAGGLGYAFMQYLSAEQKPGADLLLDLLHFDDAVSGAAAVITGEGHADRQTLMGKLPQRVMLRAARQNVPTWLIAGRVDDCKEMTVAGFTKAISTTPDGADLSEAMKKETAIANIASAVRQLVSDIKA